MAKGKTQRGEIERRSRLAYALLSQGWLSSEIMDVLSRQFNVATNACQGYIRVARDRMLADAELTEHEIKAQSLAFYTKLARNTKHHVGDRITARRQIDRIFGVIKPPQQQHVNNNNSFTVNRNTGPELSVDQQLELRKEAKVRELMNQYTELQIDRAKAFDLPLPDDVKLLSEKVESARNITPRKAKKK